VGLRLLLKEISSSKKLIDLCCLLDLMRLVTQCFEDLSEDYDEFKTLTHRVFPNIINTKFIVSSDKFKNMFSSMALRFLCEQLLKPPFQKVDFEIENPYLTYSLDNSKEHEADYEMFLTGYCFKYLKVLFINFQPSKCKETQPVPKPN
jgi:poly(A)-specific ribonuclease